MSQVLSVLTRREKTYLRRIGLSKSAIRLYEALLGCKSLTAKEAAGVLNGFPSAMYRLFGQLENRQLVRLSAGRPQRYTALALKSGLQASLSEEQYQLEQLVNPKASAGQASIIAGRQAIYENYMAFARHAQQHICIFAIGIAYSESLAQVQAEAIARGVTIRHVVQEVKAANYHVVHRWQKIGVRLRVLKRPRGYHLVVIDNNYASITLSNPADTEERISLVTTNGNTIAILQAQFDAIWQSARPLKL